MADLLVAIDPGLRACGVAIFSNGELAKALLVKSATKDSKDDEAWFDMWFGIETTLIDLGYTEANELACEFMKIYRGPRQKGDQEDIIQVNCAVSAICMKGTWGRVTLYRPHQWKGEVPKKIHNARVLGKLTSREKSKVEKCAPSLMHNVIDAIGIGLHHLHR